MGEFSIWHILILLVVILIFFGPSRLPGLGNSLGKAIRGFKDGIKGIGEDEKPATTAHEALSSPEKSTDPTQQSTKTTSNT